MMRTTTGNQPLCESKLHESGSVYRCDLPLAHDGPHENGNWQWWEEPAIPPSAPQPHTGCLEDADSTFCDDPKCPRCQPPAQQPEVLDDGYKMEPYYSRGYQRGWNEAIEAAAQANCEQCGKQNKFWHPVDGMGWHEHIAGHQDRVRCASLAIRSLRPSPAQEQSKGKQV